MKKWLTFENLKIAAAVLILWFASLAIAAALGAGWYIQAWGMAFAIALILGFVALCLYPFYWAVRTLQRAWFKKENHNVTS